MESTVFRGDARVDPIRSSPSERVSYQDVLHISVVNRKSSVETSCPMAWSAVNAHFHTGVVVLVASCGCYRSTLRSSQGSYLCFTIPGSIDER